MIAIFIFVTLKDLNPDERNLIRQVMETLLMGKIQQNGATEKNHPSLTKFKDDIVRACQFALDVKWENRNNAQMRRREAKRKQEEEQLNWIKFPSNEEWHEDAQDWSK